MNERVLQSCVGYCSRKMNEISKNLVSMPRSMEEWQEYNILLTLENCATKQIPLVKRYDKELNRYYCVRCGAKVTASKRPRYCKCCGQLLINGEGKEK